MTITSDLNAWWDELSDYEESNTAKAKFQEIMIAIEQYLNELAQMNSNGDFDKLPPAVKSKFVWAWNQLDSARDTVKADSDFMEAITWKP